MFVITAFLCYFPRVIVIVVINGACINAFSAIFQSCVSSFFNSNVTLSVVIVTTRRLSQRVILMTTSSSTTTNILILFSLFLLLFSPVRIVDEKFSLEVVVVVVFVANLP